jgi:hypothetical protein
MFCMRPRRSSRQPDFFEPRQLDLFEKDGRRLDAEEPPADFVQRIREELLATLAKVRGAEALPWRDLTQATLAELRFHSIAGWLPEEEANALRSEFAQEINRLWEVSEEPDAGSKDGSSP